MNGWIKISRDIVSHWIFKDDVRFKWWVTILFTVNWKDEKMLIGNKLVECKRGQSVKSLRTWAKQFKVTPKTVSEFFTLLESDKMIITENIGISTRITICNYESYQETVNGKETVGKQLVNTSETDGKQLLPTIEESKEVKEKSIKKKIPFSESEYFKNVKLLEKNIDPKFLIYDLEYYHDKVWAWSEEGNDKINWLSTIITFIRRDGEKAMEKSIGGHKMVY